MALTPQQVAAKWQRNTAASGQAYKDGINAVTQSPMEAAANQADRYIAGVTRAVESGKWQAGLRRTSLSAWKQASTEYGAQRLADGAKKAQPKMESFMTEFMPHVMRVADTVRQMPKGGLQNGINRAVAQIEGNANFRRAGR